MEPKLVYLGEKVRPAMIPFAVIAAVVFISSFTEMYSSHAFITFTMTFVMFWLGSLSLVAYFYSYIGPENLGPFMRWYARKFFSVWFVGLALLTAITPILVVVDYVH